MAKRPATVKVGPHTYTILWSEKSWRKYLHKGASKDSVGKTEANHGRIFVNGWNQTISQQKDTLLHEILHACFATILFGESEILNLDDINKVEEYVIRVLTPMLLGVLQENEELTEWLKNG